MTVCAPWARAHRIAFRCGFSFVAIYFFPWPIGALPGTEEMGARVSGWVLSAMPWLGRHVFAVPYPVVLTDTGSSDRTCDWLLLACSVALAGAAAFVWSLVARRTEYERLRALLEVYLRYFLAFSMLTMGLAKLAGVQFAYPLPIRQFQPIGEQSPMGLMWTFMGVSRAYNAFAGGAECAGGLLLLWRRTTPLGALLLLPVLANVVLLNFCYDVCVKIGATQVFLVALWLAWPDARRILALLVARRSVSPQPAPNALPRRSMRIARTATKTVLISAFVFFSWRGLVAFQHEFRGSGSPIDGAWQVVQEIRDGVPLAPLTTDRERWQRVGFGWNRMFVQAMDGRMRAHFTIVLDERAHTVTLTPERGDLGPAVLAWQLAAPDRLTLAGHVGDADVRLELRKLDVSHTVLASRGFHFINESAFNE